MSERQGTEIGRGRVRRLDREPLLRDGEHLAPVLAHAVHLRDERVVIGVVGTQAQSLHRRRVRFVDPARTQQDAAMHPVGIAQVGFERDGARRELLRLLDASQLLHTQRKHRGGRRVVRVVLEVLAEVVLRGGELTVFERVEGGVPEVDRRHGGAGARLSVGRRERS